MTGGPPEQLALLDAEPDPERPPEGFVPTPAQRDAIACRDRDVFTEAGAGSGKTGVLVERYCDCVTEDGLGPEEILAFTFTDRAAAELRQRVRRRLIERAHAAAERGDLELARDIARAAREGERAWITTIHGFCRRVLAAHPVAAHMDPRFRVLDDSEASRLRERAFSVGGRGGRGARGRAGGPVRRGLLAAAPSRPRRWRPRTAAQPGRRSAAPA